jgi:hypothetical protein
MTSSSRPPSRPPPFDPAADDPLDGGEGNDDTDDARSARDPDARPPLDRIVAELIRKGLEAGRGPLEKVSESFFPKDIGSHLVNQLGDIRSGVVKAVAQEVGRFLRDADIASELRKVLTGLDVEAQVRLRFSSREDGSVKPHIEVDLDSSTPSGKRKKARDDH